jgi:hypothetical protein
VSGWRTWIKGPGRTALKIAVMAFLFAAGEICWAIPCPTDQDPGDDLGNDACFELGKFIVPPVPGSQDKSAPGGWGSLVLTFDREIDGGSFIFKTDCPDPTDGTLSPDKKSILLKPSGVYKIVATGSPAVKDKTKVAETFDVTILYDIDAGVPNLVFGFWKSKLTDFTYRPNPGDYSNTSAKNDFIFDVPLPEPSTVPLAAAGCALLLAFCRRRRPR